MENQKGGCNFSGFAKGRNLNRRSQRPQRGKPFGFSSIFFIFFALFAIFCSNSGSLAANPCDPFTSNPIACENSKPGAPKSEWDLDGPADSTILGFAADISVNIGETVRFKVDTDAADYRIDIYRVGFYQGHGARFITTVLPSATLPQVQPAPLTDSATGLIDCGNWAESASWPVPANAASGFYIGKLVRTDTGGASHIYFVVRDDAGGSDILFQTADTTWVAYNAYGGRNLYDRFGTPNPRAYKVSYNRPITTRDTLDWASLFLAEYPMIRWLEANGYDVSYTTGVDSARRGHLLLQHRLFLSVGHDEYWSGEQRANVEAARDAGVHLAFFSGNEVFWKIRWEPSLDGSGTPYQTLVCYKETKANAKIDPHPEWTGTWRDPRFSADGGYFPEYLLTGTSFIVNGVTLNRLEVPAEYGVHRFWRNTTVAALEPGETAVFGHGTLGFEWDEAPVNGPAGLMRLSLTTVDGVPVLQDYGNLYASGQATHSLALYRHSSGALVFGAGTVQWSWGLDDEHDSFIEPAADARLQQATVNLFADMGVQPFTLQAGLVPASQSTDVTPPASFIDSPGNGEILQPGRLVTITGTAADSGGQLVGVEVSTDGGITWVPAVGRSAWTYAWTPATPGSAVIKSRAVDDSGNLETPSAGVGASVAADQLTLWPGGAVPAIIDGGPDKPIEVGVKFRSDFAGAITDIRFYKAAGNSGPHVGNLWATNGTLLASGTFSGETISGWQQVSFSTPVAILPNTPYVASYHCPKGHYSVNRDYFNDELNSSPLYGLDSESFFSGNGVYIYSANSAFPVNTFRAANYWVDVAFEPVLAIMTASPEDGFLDITYSTTLRVIGGKKPHTWAISAGSLPPGLTLDPATGAIAGMPTATGAFDFTAQVTDASNPRQTAIKAFKMRVYAGQPVTIWPDAAVPTTVDGGPDSPVQLGVKFIPQVAGVITGIRFYKSIGNTGRHVANLWTGTGVILGAALFENETSSGWQEAQFADPIEVTAGTVYVASYHSERGHYSIDLDYFTSSLSSGSLLVPGSSASGGNGVYAYGPSSVFPNQNYRAANYWVDVNFQAPLAINTVSMANGILGMPYSATLTASSGKTPYVWSIASGALAPGLSLNPSTGAITGTPTSVGAFSFTARVSDSANPVQSFSKPFTFIIYADKPLTIWPETAVHGFVGGADQPVELGVKFQSDVAGAITGIRFYKFSENTGTHLGNLWTAGGTLLASATFTAETQTGWQQVDFSTPIQIAANTVYVASYFCPKGYYGINLSYFSGSGVDNAPLHAPAAGNGVYVYGGSRFPNRSGNGANYWVDVAFQAPLSIVTASLPIGYAGQTYSATLIGTSGKKPYAWSISAGVLPNGLTLDPATGAITGVATDAGVFNFTAQVNDSAGQIATRALTLRIYAAPKTIWPDTATPAIVDAGADKAVQLGVKFRSDVAGTITGIRFYKSAANVGTHVARLWTTNGALLATATFTAETASGWQSVSFNNPVAITANTVYVASYHCPGGHYSLDRNYFAVNGVDNPPLHALANGQAGANGVYAYGTSSVFPTKSSAGANYWVDAIFSPDAP